jgi:hypothetical protein
VEGDEELACSQATSAERLLYDTLASVGWDVLYPPRVRLKERKKVLACVPLPPIEFPQFFPSLIMQHLSQGSADTLVLQVETTWAPKAENTTALASAHEDVEGLVRKVALLGGELAEVRRVREVVEERFHSLSHMSADGMRRLVVSEKERRE